MKTLSTIVHEFGNAKEVVKLIEEACQEPGPDEVVVEMQRAAINPSDLISISGVYSSRTFVPYRPGFEGVGTVAKVGSDVKDLAVGTRVLPIGTSGSWSYFKTTKASWCFPISDKLSLEEAATMYVNPATAWLMLHYIAKVQPEHKVIISAAGSEIGCTMIRMLNAIGVEPIVTVRREYSANKVKALKVAAILNSTDADFDQQLQKATGGRTADLVLDAVGDELGFKLAHCVKPGGLFLHYGLLSGKSLPQGTLDAIAEGRFEFFMLRDWIHSKPRKDIENLFAKIEELISDGVVKTVIDTTFPLSQITDALTRAEKYDREGKILLSL